MGIDPFEPLPHAALLKIYSERPDQKRASVEKSSLAIVFGRATEAPTQGVFEFGPEGSSASSWGAFSSPAPISTACSPHPSTGVR